ILTPLVLSSVSRAAAAWGMILDRERDDGWFRDPQPAPTSRKATRVARWFPGRVCHRDRGAERLFRSVCSPSRGADRPGVGPAYRLSRPLCGDLVRQRLSLSALGCGPWSVRFGPACG